MATHIAYRREEVLAMGTRRPQYWARRGAIVGAALSLIPVGILALSWWVRLRVRVRKVW
jgi:hypothetical protein